MVLPRFCSGLYAAGLTVRDIRADLEDVYGLQVSPDLISRVTDAVLDEVRNWQSRALDRMYPIVIFDALRVKTRSADSRRVKKKAVYVALGVNRNGVREVLDLWIAENEDAKFWLSVITELKNRGGQDILIAVVDGQSLCISNGKSGTKYSTPSPANHSIINPTRRPHSENCRTNSPQLYTAPIGMDLRYKTLPLGRG